MAVDAELPDTFPTTLFAHLSQPLGSTVARIMVGREDDDYVTLAAPFARSYAAALLRLADVLEGLVSL
ncbi:MAG TPA: hypothetical protein VJU82_14405 [Acidobacteriaceae bacterium]|nr:hypothetical protein [Acidobacteriaceae bacterium]